MKFSGFIICSIIFFSCNQSDEKPIENKILETNKNIRRQLIQDMASKYNVERNWIPDSLILEDVFTIELQEMVLGDSSRTILLYAHVKDIKKTSTGYRAILQNSPRSWGSDIYYDLAISKEQVDYLFSHPNSILEEYAIIAHISQVVRTDSRITLEEGAAYIPPYIYLNIPGNFILRGNCLDILYRGFAASLWDIE